MGPNIEKHKNTQNTENTFGHSQPYNEPHMPKCSSLYIKVSQLTCDAWMERGGIVGHVFAYPPSKMAPMKKSYIFSTLVSTNYLSLTTFVLMISQDILFMLLLLLVILLLLLKQYQKLKNSWYHQNKSCQAQKVVF